MNVENQKELADALFKAIGECKSHVSVEKYNVFKVIEPCETEICALIADLINPKSARHDFGKDFLEKFLRTLGEEPFPNAENAAVKIEKSFKSNANKGRRRIDIAIECEGRFVPLEVKIHAKDQSEQCAEYFFAFAQGKKAKRIYYVTPRGRFPSVQSMEFGDQKLKNGENLKLVSFSELADWVDDCKSAPNLPDCMSKALADFSLYLRKVAGEETEFEKTLRQKVGGIAVLSKFPYGQDGWNELVAISTELMAKCYAAETRQKIIFAIEVAKERVWPDKPSVLAKKILKKYGKCVFCAEPDGPYEAIWFDGFEVNIGENDTEFTVFSAGDDAKAKLCGELKFGEQKDGKLYLWHGVGENPCEVFQDLCDIIDKMLEFLNIKY